MSRKVLKEENGSPDFVSGNVVGCFLENYPHHHVQVLQYSQSIHLARCGPSALGHLPGLPWSLAERRRKKKHLAQGIDLTTNKTNPSGLNDPRMGLKILHQCLFQCNLDIIAPSWPATMPGLLWRRPTYTGLLPKDIDAM